MKRLLTLAWILLLAACSGAPAAAPEAAPASVPAAATTSASALPTATSPHPGMTGPLQTSRWKSS